MTIPNAGEDEKKNELAQSYIADTADGNVKCGWQLWKTDGPFLINSTHNYHITQQVHPWVLFQRNKTYVTHKTCMWMFLTALFLVAKPGNPDDLRWWMVPVTVGHPYVDYYLARMRKWTTCTQLRWIFFLRFYLFIWPSWGGGQQAGVEGEEAGSPLSREPDVGLHRRMLGSWPEPKAEALTHWATQAP